jgi:DNA-binding NarL/FixJ family response regulator
VGVKADATRTAVLHDPHPLWLGGLRRLLEREGVAVIGEATDARQALDLVRRHAPDLLVTTSMLGAGERDDHSLPSGVRTIVLADTAEPGAVQAAFAAGASAYVLKSAHADDLATAVRQAFAPTVFTMPRASSVVTLPASPPELDRLTQREREILGLVAEGRSNDDVARLLWVSRQTVKFHLSSVYRKLGVSNRTEAGRWAYAHGLLAENAASLAA